MISEKILVNPENKKIEEYKNSKVAKEFQAAFPDAKLLDIKEE